MTVEPSEESKNDEPDSPDVDEVVEDDGDSSRSGMTNGSRAQVSSSSSNELKLSTALLFSWVLAGLASSAVLALRVPLPRHHRWSALLDRHVHDFGYMLVLGLLSYLLTWLYRSCVSTSRRYVWPAVALAGASLAFLSLGEDLSGLLGRLSAYGGRWLWLSIVAVFVGGVLALVAWLLDRLARRSLLLRGVAVGGGLVAVIANHFVLQLNYPIVHLFVVLFATAAMGVSLRGLKLSGRWIRWAVERRCVVRGVWVVGGAVAALAMIRPPSSTTWRDMFRSSGCVGAPLMAKFMPDEQRDSIPPVESANPWFSDRSHVPAIPPHRPGVLPPNPIVIFMTMDAVRAEVINSGAHAALLPNLYALRRDSVYFSNARAPTPSTITTIASMFSGKYYSSLYWTRVGGKGRFKNAIQPHKDKSPWVSAMLTKAGVTTVHMISLYGLKGELGTVQGMKEQIFTRRDYGAAADLMNRTIARLKKDHTGPMFFYMHFIDSHAPYNLAGKQGTPYQRYLREIALEDKELGKLRAYLKSAGLADRAVLIVGADHGEAFGEHHTHYHAVTVYEELLRVPLIIHVPGVKPRTVTEPVTLMDMGPTLLDMFGLATPGHFMGQSLVPFLQGKNPHLERPIAADAGRRMQALYLSNGLKAIRDLKKHTQEVYDLKRDPKELHNIVETPRGRKAMRLLRAFFEVHRLHKPGYRAPWRLF